MFMLTVNCLFYFFAICSTYITEHKLLIKYQSAASAALFFSLLQWEKAFGDIAPSKRDAKDVVPYKMGANFYVLSVGADSISARSFKNHN